MTLLKLGAAAEKDDKDKYKYGEDLVDRKDKQRISSLASFIDQEKKIKHDEEEHFKRLQRDREKMAEAEKKLKRAQERATLEMKRLKLLGAGKGVDVGGGGSGSDKEKSESGSGKFEPGKIFLDNPSMTALLMFTLGLTYAILGFSTAQAVDRYTLTLPKKNPKISAEEANAYTDSAKTAANTIGILGIIMLIVSLGLAYLAFNTAKDKPIVKELLFKPMSHALFLFLFVMNLTVFLLFMINIMTSWYSELDNSGPTGLLVVSLLMTIGLAAWVAKSAVEYRAARFEKAGAKAAAVTSAAKAAAGGLKK